MFFTSPEDARWNAKRQAVEFGVEIGEYRGVVRVPRRVFQRLLAERPTPERCVEAYTSAHQVRKHRRAQTPPAAVDRGRQRRDQRARSPPCHKRSLDFPAAKGRPRTHSGRSLPSIAMPAHAPFRPFVDATKIRGETMESGPSVPVG